MRIFGSHEFLVNSNPFPIIPSRQYRASRKISGIRGKPGSALFGVFVLNKEGKELARLQRWINNFDGIERQYDIVFSAPADADHAVVGYRCNVETLQKSEVDITFQDLDDLQLEELDGSVKDSHDDWPTLQPLTRDQEDLLETKIIWLFGYYRSGTTWFARDLLSNKSVRFWNEPDIWVPLLFESHSDSSYFFSRMHKKNWINLFRSLILTRTYSEILSLDDNVLIKDPRSSRIADILTEYLPKSRMIFLIRDGRDVIDSLIDAMMPGGWETKELGVQPIMNDKEKQDAIRAHAEAWKASVETTARAFDMHNPGRRLFVRYEDLREKTFVQVRRIYQFLDIPIADNEIEEIVQKYSFESIPESERGPHRFNRSATPGAWKNNFSKSEIELIHSVIGPTLKRFGYKV